MKTLVTLLAAIAVAMPALAVETVNSEDVKMMVDMKFSKMDTNHDGQLSREEHAAGANQMFMDADANGDGMLTKDELMAHQMHKSQKMADKKNARKGQ
jgi:hypothetical protein